MRWSCAILALACSALCSEGTVLKLQEASSALSLEESGEWAELSQAEAEDRRFLLTQLDETEDELVKLQHFLESAGTAALKKTGFLAGLQISATPPANSVAKSAPVAKAVAAKPVAKMPAMPKMPKMKLQGAAALAPMLAMMKSLYDDSKERISQQNKREAKSKAWFATKEAEHKAKLAQIEGKFKNHTLSEEFRTNETRDENRYFNYWSRCRERQHRQFHTNLKIQHGMMMKAKKMIGVYEKALSSKPADKKQAAKEVRQMTGMPDIMFLQKAVGGFCQESLDEVRKERSELQQWAKDGLA
jgi:hypothetical protein